MKKFNTKSFTAMFVASFAFGIALPIVASAIVLAPTPPVSSSYMTVTSPNGGEVWYEGTVQNITWTAPVNIVAAYADIKLNHINVCTGQICPKFVFAPYMIATKVNSGGSSSYAWNVGDNTDGMAVPDGTYTVSVCQTGTTNCDSSDATFTISTTPAPASAFTVSVASAASKSAVAQISVDLARGNQDSNVTTLQQFLISQNTGPAAQALSVVGATSYFGNLTRAALVEFQTSIGISPANGTFGSATRAYIGTHY